LPLGEHVFPPALRASKEIGDAPDRKFLPE
jgi:hypothetical protein